jgi:hydrogenase maturation factor
LGKLPPASLRDVLSCIKRTSRVIVPPMPGFDAGAHELEDDVCMVVAMDPCIGVPKEWFGWLLVHYSASDVAVFGAQPKFCTINLLGPPGTRKQTFKDVMKQACSAADELGMSIVTGHTGTYEGLSALVATCTAYGFVSKDKLITPSGAKPDDYILCTKSIGLETVVNFVLVHKKSAKKLFGHRRASELAEQVKMQTCVEEALLLAKVGGVSAMHDATEGGLVAALNEIADASQLGFLIDFAKLPITFETRKLADYFHLTLAQTLSMSSTGTLLAAISPNKKEKIVKALSKRGFNAKIVGVFSENKERLMKLDGKHVRFPRKAYDPYAQIFV